MHFIVYYAIVVLLLSLSDLFQMQGHIELVDISTPLTLEHWLHASQGENDLK